MADPIHPKSAPLRFQIGPWLLEAQKKSLVISFGLWGARGPRPTVREPMRGGRGAGIESWGAGIAPRGAWGVVDGPWCS